MWGEVDAYAALTQPDFADFLRRALYNDRASRVTTCRSMRWFPQLHGLTQAHFPPRPLKTARRSDITTVIWPHRVPQTRHNSAPPRHRQESKSFSSMDLFCVDIPEKSGCLSEVYTFGPVLAKGFGFGSHVGCYSRTRIVGSMLIWLTHQSPTWQRGPNGCTLRLKPRHKVIFKRKDCRKPSSKHLPRAPSKIPPHAQARRNAAFGRGSGVKQGRCSQGHGGHFLSLKSFQTLFKRALRSA